MRAFATRNARWLAALYAGVEAVLVSLHPLLARIGYRRLDKPFLLLEKGVKGFLFDSQSCGQCVLGATGMACPMNCPKELRNGPCGGVRPDGGCEIKPDMKCVWVLAWEGSQRMGEQGQRIHLVQPPVDQRLRGTSAWLREVRQRRGVDQSLPE